MNAYWLWRLVWCRCWFVEIVMETARGECGGIDLKGNGKERRSWFENGELECV